jgi:DNA-binding winged helix-turn-helix (wHTH) protein
MTAVAAQGQVLFTGPEEAPGQNGTASVRSRLFLASPDTAAEFLRRTPPPRAATPNATLLCVTYEALETELLYEGADDIVIVPCSAAELQRRLLRLWRRFGQTADNDKIQVGPILLDSTSYHVSVDSVAAELTWMEFQLLKFLMQHAGEVFTREQLLSRVWGQKNFVGTRTVDVHIRGLRYKLGPKGDAMFKTVRNVGYGLVEQPQSTLPEASEDRQLNERAGRPG